MPDLKERDVSLADKSVETSQYTRYKGVKARVDRIAIISSKLTRAFRYFHEPSRQSFRAPVEDEELFKLCRTQLGEPEQRFGLVLFQYTVNELGELVDEKKCQGQVKIWSISEARYEELSSLHRSWPLLDGGFAATQYDIQVTCSEEKFQRMNFTPQPKAHWKSKESWYKTLKDKDAKAKEKVKMALGRKLSGAEIMEVLGMAPAQATGSTEHAGDIDLSDVLEDDE